MRTLRLLLQSLFVVANIAAVALLIASAYSDRVSPEKGLLFSYLGLAFPLICAGNLCFVVYWVFWRKWKFLLIGLGAFLVCLGPIRHYFPLHASKKVDREKVLKVLTYNVMAFGYRNHTKDSPNPIIQYIAESGADIVCLQEYAVARSGKHLTASKVFKALDMYPYRSVFYLNARGARRLGIAVLSKYPISRSRRVDYESTSNGSTVHELDIEGKKLTLINNHLESFKLTMEDRTRYATYIKSLDSEGLNDLRGDFGRKLSTAFRIRAKQAEAVAREVENAKGDYVLVCGDFNDTPISYAHRTIQGDLVDAFAESGRGMGVTYNQNFFWFRIDNILHSQNMTSINCSVDEIPYSDHYPLWCYLRLE